MVPPVPRFTVISPVYNEEQVVPLFFERLLPVVGKLSENYCVEVLFLNNASTDGTFDAIAKLRMTIHSRTSLR